jgi:hypothetical protein
MDAIRSMSSKTVTLLIPTRSSLVRGDQNISNWLCGHVLTDLDQPTQIKTYANQASMFDLDNQTPRRFEGEARFPFFAP